MLGSKPPEAVADLLTRLAKRHRKLLKSGEVFLAACHAFAPDGIVPEPLTRRGRQPSSVATPEEALERAAAARFRLAAVHTALGTHDEPFTELPESGNGYLLAHTDRRMLIFDGSGKNYQLQAPMKGLWVQAVDHGDDMYTLVFNNGEERVAATTRRESVEFAQHFIESFPDRRQQARIVIANDDPNAIEF